MESSGEVLDVAGGDTSHGDTAVVGHVDVVLLAHLKNLLLGDARVAEHTNLGGNVAPVAGRSLLLEVSLEEVTHLDDAVSHALALIAPLGLELGVAEDGLHNAGSVSGRVGVHGSDEKLELGLNAGCLVLVLADNTEGSNTLTVQAKVLGEGLAQAHLVALLHEEADGGGILLSITRGEALVCAVEERHVALGLHDVRDLAPHLHGGVRSSRVVGTSVKEEGGAVWGVLDVLEHGIEVKTDELAVEVSVLLNVHAGVLEDGDVVSPSRVRHVDGVVGGDLEAVEELGDKTAGTSAGESLHTGDVLVGKGARVSTVGELEGEVDEGLETGDTEVLLVDLVVEKLLLSSTNGGENPGLAVVVTVSTNAKAYLARVLVVVEHLRETKDRVGRAHGHIGPRAQGTGSRRDGGGRAAGAGGKHFKERGVEATKANETCRASSGIAVE